MKQKLGFSGKKLVNKLIKKFHYEKIRQRGSHVRLKIGKDKITVPLHKELDKGTEQSILKEIAKHTNLSLEEVISKLKE